MDDERNERRKAYVAAKTHLRAYRERYYPGSALGARAAEIVTPDVMQELDRLTAVSEAARVAWETPRAS